EPLESAEAKHEPSLAFFDSVKTGGEPHRGEHDDGADDETCVQRGVAAARAAAAAAEQRDEPTLEVADDGVEIRRTLVLVGSPRIPLVAVVPSHRSLHLFLGWSRPRALRSTATPANAARSAPLPESTRRAHPRSRCAPRASRTASRARGSAPDRA